MSEKLYSENSIESLSPREFTRLRPGVYCGSTDYSTQLLIEIVSNAIDEWAVGHGSIINVDYKDDGSCRVEDFAQGFPINVIRDDGETVFQAAFDVLNTSGKFSDDGVYEGVALGLNGIGAKLVNYLASNLIATTYRDGKSEKLTFKDGLFQSRELDEQGEHHTGTIVEWIPDPQFFNNPAIDINKIKELFKVLACLCKGLTINLTHNNKNKITFYSEKGLNDLIDSKVKDTELIDNRFNINYENEKNKIDLVMTYTSNYSSNMISYVNTGETTAGPHITQLKAIITREFNKFFRDKKWLKDKDENLSGDDIQEGMYIVFNITAPGVSYDAQTKSRIVKINMTPFNDIIADSLRSWMERNEKEIKLIADKALSARRAREAAKKARDAARKPKGSGLKAKMAISNKFYDCTSKNPNERKLFLLEGVSAGAAAIEARNPKTDCIYLLRGKIISPLKNTTDKILANQEMSDLVQIIGGGFGKDFDINKCNFDKIIVFADSDSDGDQICLLLMGFFFTYMKPLVEAGKLYRGAAPLYTINQNNKEFYFYTDKEYREWTKTAVGKYNVLRGKGVGELEAKDLHRLCFASERFKQLTIQDLKETTELLEIFLGSSVTPRRDYIYANATELGFNEE